MEKSNWMFISLLARTQGRGCLSRLTWSWYILWPALGTGLVMTRKIMFMYSKYIKSRSPVIGCILELMNTFCAFLFLMFISLRLSITAVLKGPYFPVLACLPPPPTETTLCAYRCLALGHPVNIDCMKEMKKTGFILYETETIFLNINLLIRMHRTFSIC